MARTFPFVAAGAVALAAASLAVAAPQRPARQQPAQTRQLAQTAQKQPVVPGFYEGKTVRYYNFGPIKLKPGNKLAPIWTFTNGPASQNNVTRDTIAVGQTAYPPLWSITKVTWKPGARRRLLTSYAAIKKAAASGQVTLKKTPLVVNCPLV